MKLKTGTNAPLFDLKDKDGISHNLTQVKSKNIVIYFYPKDSTPGCTIEALMFNKYLNDFKKFDTTIIGISGGDEKSKTKFCQVHKLKLLLLSDPKFAVCKKYGVYGSKSFMGHKFFGINRTTFLLNKNHKIIKIYENVKPQLHAKELIKAIKSIKK